MAYGWISITGVRFSTNLGGRIDLLYPCHFGVVVFFCLGLSGLYGCNTRGRGGWSGCKRISRYFSLAFVGSLEFFEARRQLSSELMTFFVRIPNRFAIFFFRCSGQGGVMCVVFLGRTVRWQASFNKDRCMSQDHDICDTPWGTAYGGGMAYKTQRAFLGKTKELNIFSFPWI